MFRSLAARLTALRQLVRRPTASLAAATILSACGPGVDGMTDVPRDVAESEGQELVLPTEEDNRNFRSWGDPHEITFDGCQYDNSMLGVFVKVKADQKDFLVATKHDWYDANHETTGYNLKVNKSIAVAVCATGAKNCAAGAKNMVRYNAQTNTLDQASANLTSQTVKGVTPLTLSKGAAPTPLAAGGTVQLLADGTTFKVVSALGDTVEFKDQGDYLDFKGVISAKRPLGSVRGTLGRFDLGQDPENDLVAVDGTSLGYCPWGADAADAETNPDLHKTVKSFRADGYLR
jgi:hypothetical protein